MFDKTLLDSSPQRTPILTGRHWLAGLCVSVMGMLAGFVIVPMISDPSPKALVIEAALLGVCVMFYELMIWYVLTDARHLGLDSGKWSVALLLLNVVGFVAYLIYSASKTGEWKRATLPLAYVFQGIVVCVLLLFPLVSTQALPDAHRLFEVLMPTPPAAPAHPAATPHVRPVDHHAVQPVFEEPFRIPPTINIISEKPDAPEIAHPDFNIIQGGLDYGNRGTVSNPVLSSILAGARPDPPPSVTSHEAKVDRVRLSCKLEEAKLIFHPSPQYPELAKMARIQGTVVLEAIISRDGTIQDLKASSGHPLLVPAAVDAVRRWRYQPTLLNGEAVEVSTEVQVRFILNE